MMLILRMVALLVPRWQRADWQAEWQAELWHLLHVCTREGPPPAWNWQAIHFCLGAFWDAVWLRRHNCNPEPPFHFWLQ